MPVLTYNVASSMFNFAMTIFVVVFALGIGFLVYAAKQLKKCEGEKTSEASE